MSKANSNVQRRRNLIVNYIPSSLQEDQLYDLFATVGPIKSLRIMRNADGTGKGYGFVEYQHQSDAVQAIEEFDGKAMKNKNLKVAFARPGGSREGCNLFVKNLPTSWTTEKLTEVFSNFGVLLECRVLSTNDRQSRRCGFVRFDLPRDAQNALREMNGFIPRDGNFQIKVTHATKRSHGNDSNQMRTAQESFPARQPQSNRGQRGFKFNANASNYRYQPTGSQNASQAQEVFQRPIGYGSRDYEFDPMFYQTQYGHGSRDYEFDPMFCQTQYGHGSRDGFGSRVNDFEYTPGSCGMRPGPDPEIMPPIGVQDPTSVLNRSNQDSHSDFDQSIPVEQTNQIDNRDECTVMLASFPTFLDEHHIKHICSKYGTIVHVTMQKDNNGNSLGCAIVKFATQAEKNAALEGLNGCEMCNKRIVCQ